MALKSSTSGYDSTFEEDVKLRNQQRERHALIHKEKPQRSGMPSKLLLASSASNEEGKRLRYQLSNLTVYERHKLLINHYVLYYPGSTALLQRDGSRDRRDIDVIKENHQFLWDAEDAPDCWERQLAKKYFDKLFKEYCICDLSCYKENQVGMRWRIEKEVLGGKGQFSCGEKRCSEVEDLRTWEMNFSYNEQGVKRNALVKLRLCRECSYKVNYFHKRKEVTKKSKDKHKICKRKKEKKNKHEKRQKHQREENEHAMESEDNKVTEEEEEAETEDNIWKGPAKITEEKSREEEFEEYLEDLFL